MIRSQIKLALLGILVCAGPAIGVVIQGEGSTNEYDRFSSGYPSSPVENTNFFLNPDDFHGVGWNNANSNQSFALITPQHIIGANHFQPGVGATINFFGASGSIVSRTVSGIATVQNGGSNTDVFVAQLSSVLSGSEVPYYRFPSDLASASLVGRAMYAYGFPAQVGQNTIASRDGIAAVAAFGNQAELANTPTFEFVYDSAFAANGQARAEPGDSGSPTFIQENGTYVLAGTHSALAQVGTVYTTGDADLTRMMNEINTAIGSLGSTGFQIDQIPEPSASSLVLLSVFAFCISRSRGKNAK